MLTSKIKFMSKFFLSFQLNYFKIKKIKKFKTTAFLYVLTKNYFSFTKTHYCNVAMFCQFNIMLNVKCHLTFDPINLTKKIL